MDKAFVQQIFEPFARAKDSRTGKIEGTGLGMTLARNIVQMMGGDIQVERLLNASPGAYDLVLMDIQMPNMNGCEATDTIRNSGREDLRTLPIVAMSADAFLDDIQHAKAVGMNGHIAKPIELNRLAEVLERWLGKTDESARNPEQKRSTKMKDG